MALLTATTTKNITSGSPKPVTKNGRRSKKTSTAHQQTRRKVTRIYTTVCFWHPCAKTPHVLSPHFLSFFSDQFLHQRTKSFKSLFFHLAGGRHISLRHAVAIDPLIDSIPESSIDGWASAALHLTGAIFFRWFQQGSICWAPATFVFVQACKHVTST